MCRKIRNRQRNEVLGFFYFRNNLSSVKDTNYAYLRDIAVVALRGEAKLCWKERHSDKEYKKWRIFHREI